MGDHEKCMLRSVNGGDIECDAEDCVFWSSPDRLSLLEADHPCAVAYFKRLGGDEDLGEWLLATKQRLDDASGGPAVI
jgi:hypothetical protein